MTSSKCIVAGADCRRRPGRGLDTEMYREFAHLQGRMIGVPYAEGLDVMRLTLA